MNPAAVVIAALLLTNNGLHRLAECLNLRNIAGGLPAEFKDAIGPARYRRIAAYQRAKTRVQGSAQAAQLLALLGFWFADGFAWLETTLQSFPLGLVARGTLYIGVLLTLGTIVALPFQIMAIFGIEARFGFNRTTLSTFLWDRVKAGGLLLLLGVPLLAAVLALLAYAGSRAWWWGWLTVSGFMLVIGFVGPTWIMPLFNQFTPLPEGPLRQAVLRCAADHGFPVADVLTMDGSRRTSKANAFFTGLGRHRRIVLFDTLVAQYEIREVVAVLRHEIGHWENKHILWQLAAGVLQTGVFFYLLAWVIERPELHTAFGMDHAPVYAGLVFAAIVFTPLATLGDVCLLGLARRFERQADACGLKTPADAQDLIEALQKLARHHLANPNPHPLFVWLYHSHPPVLARIEALRGLAANLV